MFKSTIITKISISVTLIWLLHIPKIGHAECIWINKGGALSGHELTALAVDRENTDTVFVGSKGALFKTTDGGENWKNVFTVPGTSKSVNFILIHPSDPKIIYLATDSGLFTSSDVGTKWRSLPLGSEDSVLSAHVDVENKDVLFAATAGDVFISHDAGKNWTRSSEGLAAVNIRSFTQNYLNPGIVFAGAENGLFRSVDDGGRWEKIFSSNVLTEESAEEDEYAEESDVPISSAWVSIDPLNPQIIYFASKNGLFKSSDGGSSWTALSKMGLAGVITNMTLPVYEKGVIFAVTRQGVFRFSKKEGRWREFYTGLTSRQPVFAVLNGQEDALWLVAKNGVYRSKGDIYEVKEIPAADKADAVMQNFSQEPSFREIQKAAIEYAEVHPQKISRWRSAAQAKALLPKLSVSVDRDSDKNLHWDAGSNPDTWVIGPDDESTGWDVTCSWDLGDLIWNDDQTSIDVRSKLMVQLRDDILDEVTHLYFERRRLQIELLQEPPKNINKLVEKELRLQELTADIDAMTGGYLSEEIERRKN